ncbi:acetyl-CoA carboxylase biotin carboxylase subunit family protein [Streptomyces sp. NPDC004296]|uniref:ATP-grasp domain-containing protein n=1 Tax=Streptomyces sp. NPDC004296 TaxID=3364697 RepID=UPI00367B10EC
MPPSDRRPVMVVIGAGDRTAHDHVLQQIAVAHPVLLLDAEPPAWAWPHIAGAWAVDLRDAESVTAAVSHLAADRGVTGVMTYLEHQVPLTAELAQYLGLPGIGTTAAAAVHDKALLRRLLEAAGVPTATSYIAGSEQSAVDFAALLGYPVTVTPRGASASSAGEWQATTPDEARTAYRAVRRALAEEPHDQPPGVLIEESLAGPRISVECLVRAPEDVHVAAITRTSLASKGSVTSLDLVVASEDPLLADPAVLEVVERALTALRFGTGAAHVTLCRAPGGLRVIDVGGLGGGLIPLLVQLATGVSLPAAAATIAAGQRPDLTPHRRRAAAAQVLYPAHSGTLARLHRRDTSWSWLARLTPGSACVGDRVEAPPAARHVDRLAEWVVSGRSSWVCAGRLQLVAATFAFSITPVRPALPTACAR